MGHIRNAVIESARLTTEDHNILSLWLTLDYGGSCQGFGGHVLCVSPDSPHWRREGLNFGGIYIRRVLDVAGVTSFDRLKGKTIRVLLTDPGYGGRIIAIGHIIKELWFDPENEFRDRDTDTRRMAETNEDLARGVARVAGAEGIAQNTPSHPPSGNPHDPR